MIIWHQNWAQCYPHGPLNWHGYVNLRKHGFLMDTAHYQRLIDYSLVPKTKDQNQSTFRVTAKAPLCMALSVSSSSEPPRSWKNKRWLHLWSSIKPLFIMFVLLLVFSFAYPEPYYCLIRFVYTIFSQMFDSWSYSTSLQWARSHFIIMQCTFRLCATTIGRWIHWDSISILRPSKNLLTVQISMR